MRALTIVLALLVSGANPEGQMTSAQERARKALLASYEPARKMKVEVDGRASALGLSVARAFVPGAYPGTGVVAVLLDPASGITYGAHGERDLAELARERGWLKAPPPAADLLRVLNDGQFEGLLMLDDGTAPTLTASADRLVLRYGTRSFPSGLRSTNEATFPAQGKLEVQSKAQP